MAKTRMLGAYETYLKMFKKIMFWDISQRDVEKYENKAYKTPDNQDDNDYLYGLGWAMEDIGFHGWEGQAAKNEIENYDKVLTAYRYLMKALAEAIDFEDMDNEIWEYDFKNIDTNDLLELYKKNKGKS